MNLSSFYCIYDLRYKYQLIIDYVGCYYVKNSWIMLKIHELCWPLLCYQLIIDFYFFLSLVNK